MVASGGFRAKRAKSAASSSPCGGAPARICLKYSDRKNLVQNSRSVIFFGTLFKNASRTEGLSAKILCIFSFVKLHVTVSDIPSRAPLRSPSSVFSIPCFCPVAFLATTSLNKFLRASQKSSLLITPAFTVSSYSCAISTFVFSNWLRASSSAALGTPFISSSNFLICAFIASLNPSLSLSASNVSTSARLASLSGTNLRLAVALPGLFLWCAVTLSKVTVFAPVRFPVSAGVHVTVRVRTHASPRVFAPATVDAHAQRWKTTSSTSASIMTSKIDRASVVGGDRRARSNPRDSLRRVGEEWGRPPCVANENRIAPRTRRATRGRVACDVRADDVAHSQQGDDLERQQASARSNARSPDVVVQRIEDAHGGRVGEE